jgi:hypothetical protein
MGSSRGWIAAAALGLLGVAARAGFSPQQVPFVANSVTEGLQSEPAAAFTGDGVSIVVWDSDTFSEAESEIAGRLIDDAGTPIGTEFQINSSTPFAQLRPAVTAVGAGEFVVVWESYDFESGDDALGLRRVDASGNPVGDEVSIDLTEFHLRPDVAEIGAGNTVVVWDDGFDVFARRYDAQGNPVGTEFQVNAQPGSMSSARVEADAGGVFTVVWYDYRSEIDGDGDSVLMRRFDSDGSPLTGDLQVNSTTEGDQYAPSIAVRDDGTFMVVWEAYGQEVVGDGTFGQTFDSSGVAVGTEFRVDSGASAYAGYAAAAAVEGGFAVVWNEPREQGGDVLTTLMRRFDAAGTGGAVVDVDPDDQGDQANGAIASDGDRVLVAWQGFGLEDQDVFAQLFDIDVQTPTPMATSTPTFGQTPSAGCPGDCDGDGAVSIAELIRAVNIALGTNDLSSCLAADRNGNGMVAINELIAAVNAALQGCAG